MPAPEWTAGRTRVRGTSPRIQCEAYDSADFGYGDTEYHPCVRAAEYRGRVESPYVGEEVIRLCRYHYQRDVPKNDPSQKFYRFRRV